MHHLHRHPPDALLRRHHRAERRIGQCRNLVVMADHRDVLRNADPGIEALVRWQDRAGFGFSAGGVDRSRTDAEPGLQGTEMWLSIIWLLADLLGLTGTLGYRPRGVHRPEPAPLSLIPRDR